MQIILFFLSIAFLILGLYLAFSKASVLFTFIFELLSWGSGSATSSYDNHDLENRTKKEKTIGLVFVVISIFCFILSINLF